MTVDGGLRKIVRLHLPEFHWQAIESGMTSPGIPDSNYCYGGREGWVEFKQTKHWAVGLRPHQIGWLSRRAHSGGRVRIAVRQLRAGQDSLWIVDGGRARELSETGLQGLQGGGPGLLGVWYGGPPGWDWSAVRLALLEP